MNALADKERAALFDTYKHLAREVTEQVLAAGEIGEVSLARALATANRALHRATSTWEDKPSFGTFEAWAAFKVRWAILSKYAPADRRSRIIERELDRSGCQFFGRLNAPPPHVADPARTRHALYGVLDNACAAMAGASARVVDDPEADVVEHEDARHTADVFAKAIDEFSPDERAWLRAKYGRADGDAGASDDDASVKAYAAEHGLDYRVLLAKIRKLEVRFAAVLKRRGLDALKKIDAGLLGASSPTPSNDQGGEKKR